MPRRALLVGAGAMGRHWARTLASCEGVELAAWIDSSPGLAELAAEAAALTVAHTGTDLARALRDVSADFVVDVTPPEAHRQVTEQALAAGLPVLGEKPMAASMEDARAMVQAAERAGKLYMVSQSRRYNAGLQSYRELIAELGPLGILNADFYLGPHFGGFRDEMPSPLVLDMAIHTFDAARFLSGADPVRVYAEEFNPGWSWYQGNACANAVFEMTGGLRFCYRGSWCTEGCPTSWDSNWRAVGANGSALWDGDGMPTGEIVTAREGFLSETRSIGTEPRPIPSGIEGSLREFLHALDSGTTPMGECHDNIKSLAMVFGAIESAASGERVSLA